MERNTRSAVRMPVSVFSCSVASVGKLNLSATTLEHPRSSAFDELKISCDHENDMLKCVEECSFRDARMHGSMTKWADLRSERDFLPWSLNEKKK